MRWTNLQAQPAFDRCGRFRGCAYVADGDAGDPGLRRDDALAVQRLDVKQHLVWRRRTKQEILKNIFDQFNNQLAFGSF
jgi:hypothetical protein